MSGGLGHGASLEAGAGDRIDLRRQPLDIALRLLAEALELGQRAPNGHRGARSALGERDARAMADDEFTVESRTTEEITVYHAAHGHRYTFRVRERPHGRTLHAGSVQANEKAPLPSWAFKAGSRAFAEHEARKAGLID